MQVVTSVNTHSYIGYKSDKGIIFKFFTVKMKLFSMVGLIGILLVVVQAANITKRAALDQIFRVRN